MKYLWRLIALPFFAAFGLIGFLKSWLYLCWLFMKNGGEAFPYNTDRKTVLDTYLIVRDHFQNQQAPASE